METRVCKQCTIKKSIESYRKGKGYCKDCYNANARQRLKDDPDFREKERLRAVAKYQKNKEKHCAITKRYYEENLEWRKDLHLQKTYNITMDDKIRMRDSQSNKCAICGKIFVDDKSAHVDHCHTTNKVRGLLCRSCNTALGFFRDNADIMKTAIEYITKYQ